MPFPLAHPAAVLPLRRFCPQRLSLAALMIGSLAPDAAYGLPGLQLDRFAHGWLGGAAFGLLASGVMLALFAFLRGSLTAALPNPHREALWPLCQQRLGRPGQLLLSLLLGVWTHVLWDALTREHHWMTGPGPESRAGAAYLPGTDILIARLPWYASTVVGMLALVLAYGLWLKKTRGSARFWPARETGRCVGWLLLLLAPGVAILPFTLRYAEGWPHAYAVRHFFYVWSGAYLVALTFLLVVVGCGLRFAGRRTAPRPRAPGPSGDGARPGALAVANEPRPAKPVAPANRSL